MAGADQKPAASTGAANGPVSWLNSEVGAVGGVIAGIGEIVSSVVNLPLHGPQLLVLGLGGGLFACLCGSAAHESAGAKGRAIAAKMAIVFGLMLMVGNALLIWLLLWTGPPTRNGVELGEPRYPKAVQISGRPTVVEVRGQRQYRLTGVCEVPLRWNQFVWYLPLEPDAADVAFRLMTPDAAQVVKVDYLPPPRRQPPIDDAISIDSSDTDHRFLLKRRLDGAEERNVSFCAQVKLASELDPHDAATVDIGIEVRYLLGGRFKELREWLHRIYTGKH